MRLKMCSNFEGGCLWMVIWSTWMAICGGSLYAFPIWEEDLKQLAKISTEEMDVVYSAGQIGVGFGFINGFLFDFYGNRASILYSCTLLLLGIGTLSYVLRSCIEGAMTQLDQNSLSSALALGFFFLQQGSAALYQTALFTCVSAVPKSCSGVVAGTVASGYGLSASVWVFFYDIRFPMLGEGKDGGLTVAQYVEMTGAIWLFTGLFSLCLLPSSKKRNVGASPYIELIDENAVFGDKKKRNVVKNVRDVAVPSKLADDDVDKFALRRRTGIVEREVITNPQDSSGSDAESEEALEEEDELGGRSCAVSSPNPKDCETGTLPEDQRENEKEVQNGQGQKSRENNSSDLVSADTSHRLQTRLSRKEICISFEFVQVLIQFMMLQSVGSGLFIANLALILTSVGIDKDDRSGCIRGVSYMNAFGRILAGVMMDQSRNFVTRSTHMLWSGCIICSVCVVLWADAFRNSGLFYLVGFAYGANWAIMPSFISCEFGHENLGVFFNVITSFMAVGVMLVSKFTGRNYDREATSVSPLKSPQQTKVGGEGGGGGDVLEISELSCIGPNCFRDAYMLAVVLICFSLLFGIISVFLRMRKAEETEGVHEIKQINRNDRIPPIIFGKRVSENWNPK